MKILTIFLRFTLCIMLILLTRISAIFFPNLLGYMAGHMGLFTVIFFGICLYLSAICSYGIIFFAWRLLYLIDHQHNFSPANLFAVTMIKKLFYSIAIIYLPATWGVWELVKLEKAPMPITMEIFILILSLSLGAFSHVLQRVMQHFAPKSSQQEATR